MRVYLLKIKLSLRSTRLYILLSVTQRKPVLLLVLHRFFTNPFANAGSASAKSPLQLCLACPASCLTYSALALLTPSLSYTGVSGISDIRGDTCIRSCSRHQIARPHEPRLRSGWVDQVLSLLHIGPFGM